MCCAFHRRAPLLAVFISLLCGQLVVAQVGPIVTDDIAVLGERLEAAQNPGEMEAFFEATMLSLDGATISKLTSDKNDTLALRASWHSTIGRPPFKEIERIGDSVRAHRFLGFVEGRSRVTAPHWWARSLLDGSMSAGGVYSFGDHTWLQHLERNAQGYLVPPGVTMKNDAGNVVLAKDGRSITLSLDAFDNLSQEKAFFIVDMAWDGDLCYLALFSNVGERFPLVCLDGVSGRVLWSATIWAADVGVSIGARYHRVDLVIADKRVFVFGMDPRAMYCEAISAKTGKHVLRFCTHYIGREDPR